MSLLIQLLREAEDVSYQQIAPPRPRIPATVRRAVLLIRVEAACTAANGVFSLIVAHQSPAVSTDGSSGQLVTGNLGFAVDICIWLWMAKANNDGKNWARIIVTILFGLLSVGLVPNPAFFNGIPTASGAGVTAVIVTLRVVGWLIGLATVILLWNKKSGPHFNTVAQPFATGPGYPMPPTTTTMEDLASLPKPPSDPWKTPAVQDKTQTPVTHAEDDETSAFRWF
jgi:hypothetical protein